MNKNEFYSYLQQPDDFEMERPEQLKELVDTYPYFQAARLLYAKALYTKHDAGFNDELRLSSAHCSDRAKLFELIMGGELSLDKAQQEALYLKEEVAQKKKQYTKIRTSHRSKKLLSLIVDRVIMKGREICKLIQQKQPIWS